MSDYTECNSTRLSPPAEGMPRLHIGLAAHKDDLNLNQLCSTTTNEWLEQNAPGFCQLPYDEWLAITNFLFLWSLFEAKVLKHCGSARAAIEATKRWAEDGLLTKETFEPQINYFRSRYYVHGEYTCYFERLNLRQSDSPELVKEVLRNVDAEIDDVAAAILIIVYRIRNNLFHGLKWTYDLYGQLENFNHANATLMKGIDLHGKVTKKNQRKFTMGMR